MHRPTELILHLPIYINHLYTVVIGLNKATIELHQANNVVIRFIPLLPSIAPRATLPFFLPIFPPIVFLNEKALSEYYVQQ